MRQNCCCCCFIFRYVCSFRSHSNIFFSIRMRSSLSLSLCVCVFVSSAFDILIAQPAYFFLCRDHQWHIRNRVHSQNQITVDQRQAHPSAETHTQKEQKKRISPKEECESKTLLFLFSSTDKHKFIVLLNAVDVEMKYYDLLSVACFNDCCGRVFLLLLLLLPIVCVTLAMHSRDTTELLFFPPIFDLCCFVILFSMCFFCSFRLCVRISGACNIFRKYIYAFHWVLPWLNDNTFFSLFSLTLSSPRTRFHHSILVLMFSTI